MKIKNLSSVLILTSILLTTNLYGQDYYDSPARPAKETPKVQMSPIVVAAVNIERGTRLTEENIKVELWPNKVIPENSTSQPDSIVQKFARARINRGMPILDDNLSESLVIPKGYKVLAVNLSADDGIRGLLQQGDTVDVISVMKQTVDGKTSTVSKTLAKHLRIFSGPAKRRSDPNKMFVGLLVPSDQAEQIADAAKAGSLRIVLRPDEAKQSDEAIKTVAEKAPINTFVFEHGQESQTGNKTDLASATDRPNPVQQIREIARHLDQLAADLESLESFERADGLREQAQQLRLDVRSKK